MRETPRRGSVSTGQASKVGAWPTVVLTVVHGTRVVAVKRADARFHGKIQKECTSGCTVEYIGYRIVTVSGTALASTTLAHFGSFLAVWSSINTTEVRAAPHHRNRVHIILIRSPRCRATAVLPLLRHPSGSMSGAAGARVVKQIVKMTVPAGQAAPSPPVGPRLGQMGVNIMAFCKDFNAATAAYRPGLPLTTKIVAFTDRTCTFTTRSPPVSALLLAVAGVDKGASSPSKAAAPVGEVTLKQVYAIAGIKVQDVHLAHVPMRSMCKSIIGTARSCGLAIVR